MAHTIMSSIPIQDSFNDIKFEKSNLNYDYHNINNLSVQ